ncbi:uncharacterized protein F5147DRAFT_781766 [Suillus discolor]|uniref:Uncharacterized protein n=1 Tax=Suillus discolor TaxID=1912936 RepID=A0A9P7ERK9_9AGAM|nr:uncharacterized protein F5147DRAFT_781766 [Suillus discolor]KAG2086103.1 hypothetical protein F5147DRAFT_781766 [Suillus discolor]
MLSSLIIVPRTKIEAQALHATNSLSPPSARCNKMSSTIPIISLMMLQGSVTPTRAPALPTPAPALLDSPRGGAPPAPRKTAVWTAMTPPQGAMTPPDAMTPPLA